MTDNTVYTVVSDNDRPGTANSNGFFEKNAVLPNTPGASIDNTTYAVDDTVNGSGAGNGTGSFYEKNTIYESLLLDSASNAGTALPLMDATVAAIGVATKWAREDHVHPAILCREVLTGPRTYYVRTDGNDNNSGLINNSFGALLTPQKAMDVVLGTLDLNIYNVTIQIVDGTYSTGIFTSSRQVGSGTIFIQGNASDPSLVSITGPSASGGDGALSLQCVNAFVQDLSLSGPVDGLHCSVGAFVGWKNVRFGTCGANQIDCDTFAYMYCGDDYQIAGNAGNHIAVTEQGFVQIYGGTATTIGTPAFTQFVFVSHGNLEANGANYAGTGATGTRYVVNNQGFIYTGFRGPNVFPGNSPGFINDGQYDNDIGAVNIINTTASTNTTTGALTVAGGAGIVGDVNIGGAAAATTAAVDTNTTQLATTAYFFGQAGAANPLAAGTAAPGTSSRWSRQDHVHPTDTSRAPVNDPVFTGSAFIGGGLSVGGIILSSGYVSSFDSGDFNNFNGFLSTSGTAEYGIWDGALYFQALSVPNGIRFYGDSSSDIGLQVSPGQLVSVPGTTASTSTTTGALVVAGGAGIAGTLNVGGAASAATAAVDTNTTQLATTAFVLAQAAAATPLIDGTAAVGTSTRFARGDHVHPTDTTRAPTASPTFTGTVAAAAIAATGTIKSSGGALGYATGAGGTVTQATSKATGVTLSKFSGAITMNAAALASGAIVSFVMTNTNISAGDVLVLNHISGGTIGPYLLNAQCAAGSATINVRNTSAASLSEAIVIQFALVKAVNA